MRYLVLNVSRLDDYARCPMFYYWRHEKKLMPPKTEALGFGTAVHEAVAIWYRTFDVDQVLSAFWEEFAKHDLDPEVGTYGERLVRGYCKKYETDKEIFQEVTATEQALTSDFGPISALDGERLMVRLIGRPDLVVRTRIGPKRLWHIQHKTAAANTSYDRYIAAYNLNWHERAYAVLGRANGLDVQGTVLNIIRKTKQVHVGQDDEHTFKREYIPLPESSIDKFQNDILTMAARIVAESGRRPENPRSCFAYNRLCPYHDLCSGMPAFGEDFEETPRDYVVEEQERLNANR